MQRNIQSIAALLAERRQMPMNEPNDLHIDFNDWGHPIQYGWENGVAIVRAAGKDRILHTRDDITSVVELSKK